VVGDDLAGVFLGGLVITEPGVAVSGVEDPFGVVEHEVILGVFWLGQAFQQLRALVEQWTDTGDRHENRGLKNRPGRAIRIVPIPDELVTILRAHLARYGHAPDGRLFRSENGGVLYPSAYRYVWQQARPLALTPAQVVSPLARRPYDLRHGGVWLRLNAGVPATQVAEWAGHSVEVLLTIYAKCIEGRDRVWFERIDEALGGDPA